MVSFSYVVGCKGNSPGRLSSSYWDGAEVSDRFSTSGSKKFSVLLNRSGTVDRKHNE